MTPTTEELKDLLGKVTQGEWRLGVDSEVYAEGECDTWITVGPKSYDAVAIVVNEHIKGDAEVVLNARLIALAPTLAAEVVRLRDAIEDALACLQFEINPSNYDHDDACRLNDNSCEAYAILAESICMGDGHARQALDATSEK